MAICIQINNVNLQTYIENNWDTVDLIITLYLDNCTTNYHDLDLGRGVKRVAATMRIFFV